MHKIFTLLRGFKQLLFFGESKSEILSYEEFHGRGYGFDLEGGRVSTIYYLYGDGFCEDYGHGEWKEGRNDLELIEN